jgi:ribonuclease-3
LLGHFFEERKLKLELKRLIGFKPSRLELYRQAFTHKSALPSRSEGPDLSNERLEFLGDAVLSLVIGNYLYDKYPEQDEGYMSQIRARMVNRELFNSIGLKMRLNEWMARTAPYKVDAESSPALLGNTFEALVGAIFLDKGYKAACKFFEEIVLGIHLDIEELSDNNYKSRLLEWGQKNGKKIEFLLRNMEREGNRLFFEIEVEIDGEVMGSARELKKKKSEQMASREAISKLEI